MCNDHSWSGDMNSIDLVRTGGKVPGVVPGYWNKVDVEYGRDVPLRTYLNGRLIMAHSNGDSSFPAEGYYSAKIGISPHNYPPPNNKLRNLIFKEHEGWPQEYCGTIYENTDMTGWAIDVDKEGEGSYDRDIYGQGFGDQMSAIKVVAGCRIETFNDGNFNGNHGYNNCDNSDGTEDLVCDNLGATNNGGDSYQCSCGGYPKLN